MERSMDSFGHSIPEAPSQDEFLTICTVHTEENTKKKQQRPAPGCFSKALAALMSTVERAEDAPDELMRKRLLYPLCTLLWVIYLLMAVQSLLSMSWRNAIFFRGIRFVTISLFCGYMLVTKRCPLWATEVTIFIIGFTTFVFDDILSYGVFEGWSGAVIMMDCFLLTKCRDHIVSGVCYLFLAFLIVKTIEEGYDIGIYRGVPTNTDDDIRIRESRGGSWAVVVVILRVVTFYADFLMTKSFAKGMRAEQAKSEADVRMANNITGALVRFDLESAERHLSEGGGGSEDLEEAFLSLIGNLKQYRPYLPDALFSHLDEGEGEEEEGGDVVGPSKLPARQEAPGASGGELALVFTDIQSSTDIWEKHTTGMRRGMEVHNRAMREWIYRSNGYEVKTIGDAFMVAFDGVQDALRFSLGVQEELAKARWPKTLLEHPLCQAVPKEAGGKQQHWRGLRVRIGVHTGGARLEVNPTTGRADYMGPTVNKTARVEAASVGGAVAVTEEVLAAAGGLEDLGGPAVLKIGAQELKGVGSVPITLLVPQVLRDRVPDLEAAVEKRKRQQQQQQRMQRVVSGQSSSSQQMSSRGGPGESGGAGRSLGRNRLLEASGTVGTARLDYERVVVQPGAAAEAVGDLFAALLDGAGRTDGVVTATCSSVVVVGWNVSKGCVLHAVQGAKFALLVSEAVAGTKWDGLVAVGLCRGRVMHGMIGTARQRFMAAIGGCVEVSRGLADAAAAFGSFCLIGGEGAEDSVLQTHTRPVDRWDLMTVYELNLATFGTVQGVWSIFDGVVSDPWSPVYKEAFAAGDVGAVKLLAGGGDRGLVQVLRIMGKELTLPRPFSLGPIHMMLACPKGWGGEKDIAAGVLTPTTVGPMSPYATNPTSPVRFNQRYAAFEPSNRAP